MVRNNINLSKEQSFQLAKDVLELRIRMKAWISVDIIVTLK